MNLAQKLSSLFFNMRSPWGYSGGRQRGRYTGAELREIRKRNGVGRPASVNLARGAHLPHERLTPWPTMLPTGFFRLESQSNLSKGAAAGWFKRYRRYYFRQNHKR